MASPAPPYIPPKDAAYDAWASNFSSLINAAPATYGLVAGDAAIIVAAFNAWHAAYVLVTAPSTKTKTTVQDKNVQKQSSMATFRGYAITIRDNMAVSDADKVALGLNLQNNARSPILVPQTQPLLSLIGATPLSQTMRYADANTPDKRSKPFGAAALEIWQYTGVSVGTDPGLATKVATITKQPVGIGQVSGNVGKIATYWGRWIGKRGDVGPWSNPVSMTIV